MNPPPLEPSPDPLLHRQTWPLAVGAILSGVVAGAVYLARHAAPAIGPAIAGLSTALWTAAALAIWHRTLRVRPRVWLEWLGLPIIAAACCLLPWQANSMPPAPAFLPAWGDGIQSHGLAALAGAFVGWLLTRLFGPHLPTVGGPVPVAGGTPRLHVLFLNQYYAPDMAPTGQVLHELARTMAAQGHHVEVFCSRRSYDGGRLYPAYEEMEGVHVHRVPALGFGRRSFAGKLADYGSFYGILFLKLVRLRTRPDVICALTTPPYVGLLARIAATWQRCRHMHWVMDVYPDVMVSFGMLKPGWLYRRLQTLKRIELRGAALVLGLGPHMQRILETYAAPARVRWVGLWSDVVLDAANAASALGLRNARGWTDGRLVAMYSGNMGLGHRFGEFLAAAERLGPDGPRFVFSGGGKRRAEIESFAADHSQVQLMSYVPFEQLAAHLASADLHLISLDSAWQGQIVPSKTQGILAIGRPAVFVGGQNNEIATWLTEAGAGWVVAEGDVEGLLAAFAAAQDVVERERRGQAGRAFAQARFDRQTNCEAIAGLIAGAVGRSTSVASAPD
ncbi:MAG: glycosyltransferase family 4 protein [Planctomycetota bacterium]